MPTTQMNATQRRRLIYQIAANEIGTRESPANSNRQKYGAWYGLNGYAWCAMFVSWVFHKAGFPLGHIDDAKGFRYCPSALNHWRASGEITRKPTLGDIVIFSMYGRRADHTGIFVKWLNSSKTRFQTIEGNTSLGNQANGGMVMKRERKVYSVLAFVKPKVLLSNAANPSIDSIYILSRGDKGAKVTQLQSALLDLGYTIVVDGDFGPKTEKTVKAFQKDHNYRQTGIVMPALWEHIKNLLEEDLDEDVPTEELTTGVFLKKGARGAAVVSLQKLLNRNGITPKLKEDGDFGAKTLKNVKAFQRKERIDVDGVVGPQTWNRLLH